MSVPYALHAKTAESISGPINEIDPQFSTSPANEISSEDITNWNTKLNTETDGSITNEIQTLSISGNTVSLTEGGGSVTIPAGFDGNYTKLTGTPTIPTNATDLTNDAGYLTTEEDGSITNEIQTLSISGSTLSLTDGGSVTIPKASTNVSDLTNDAGYLTTETDGSTTNEIQTLSISGNTISLSNGGSVAIPNDPFVIKIGGVNISDPSINDRFLGVSGITTTFLTDKSYIYEATSGKLKKYLIVYTGLNCTGTSGAWADASNPVGPGIIFSDETNIYYVDRDAIVTTLTTVSYYDANDGVCKDYTGTDPVYPMLPNNASVIGFEKVTPTGLEVTFE